jgi:hypothetical protein
VLSLSALSEHAALYAPGVLVGCPFPDALFTDDNGLRPGFWGSARSNAPPFASGGIDFSGSPGSLAVMDLRCGLSVCSPSWRIGPVLGRTRTPAHEGFYVCAFVRLVTLPDGRYNYGAPWEGYADGTYAR